MRVIHRALQPHPERGLAFQAILPCSLEVDRRGVQALQPECRPDPGASEGGFWAGHFHQHDPQLHGRRRRARHERDRPEDRKITEGPGHHFAGARRAKTRRGGQGPVDFRGPGEQPRPQGGSAGQRRLRHAARDRGGNPASLLRQDRGNGLGQAEQPHQAARRLVPGHTPAILSLSLPPEPVEPRGGEGHRPPPAALQGCETPPRRERLQAGHGGRGRRARQGASPGGLQGRGKRPPADREGAREEVRIPAGREGVRGPRGLRGARGRRPRGGKPGKRREGPPQVHRGRHPPPPRRGPRGPRRLPAPEPALPCHPRVAGGGVPLEGVQAFRGGCHLHAPVGRGARIRRHRRKGGLTHVPPPQGDAACQGRTGICLAL